MAFHLIQKVRRSTSFKLFIATEDETALYNLNLNSTISFWSGTRLLMSAAEFLEKGLENQPSKAPQKEGKRRKKLLLFIPCLNHAKYVHDQIEH